MKKTSEKISTGVLLASSAIALFIGISDLFFNLESIPFIKKTPQISLILLGTLGFALGVERAVAFEELKDEISDIKRLINSTTMCQFIEGRQESYSLVSKIVLDAKSKIDILGVFVETETSDEFNEQKRLYLDNLIKIMQSNSNIDCRILFGVSSSNLSQCQIDALRGRFKSFKGSNLSYPSDHDTDHRQINKCLGCLWQ